MAEARLIRHSVAGVKGVIVNGTPSLAFEAAVPADAAALLRPAGTVQTAVGDGDEDAKAAVGGLWADGTVTEGEGGEPLPGEGTEELDPGIAEGVA